MELKNPSPTSSERRRSGSGCSSPEFEFWMVRNPSFPQPDLHSADELFVDGVLLPLHRLSLRPKPDQAPQSDPDQQPDPGSGPELTPAIASSSSSTLSASKRWRDIFKKSEKKSVEMNGAEEKEREKGKKKERTSGGGGGGGTELNINIWPFSRSRSAGNAGTRPRLFAGASGTRRVNSAPCSRSNSAGESKSRKWPSSPGRAGVHVGRSSPVWQVRRPKNPDLNAENESKKEKTAASGSGIAKARVLNLNVPICIVYKQHLSCRSDENSAVSAGDSSDGTVHIHGGTGNGVGSGGSIFNLRSIFSKRSAETSH